MLKEIFAVSRYTSLPGKEHFTFRNKLLSVLKIYGILFLFLIFVYAPLHKYAAYLVQNIIHYKSLDLQFKANMNKFKQKAGIMSAIYICLIGPIIEELTFRLSLSFKKSHIAFGLAFTVLLFSGLLPLVKILDNSLGLGLTLLIRACAAAVTFSLAWICIPADIRLNEKIKLSIIIISICLFSLIHIGNYSPVQWAIIWIYPIYVLPQLLIGWGITYARFKYGFIWGVMMHCLVNSVSVGLAAIYDQKNAAKHPAKHITVDTSKIKKHK
jgi:hypothetical protein